MENKKYVLMVDDTVRALLSNIIPGLMYMEVTGVPVEKADYLLLANPMNKEVTATPDFSDGN